MFLSIVTLSDLWKNNFYSFISYWLSKYVSIYYVPDAGLDAGPK